LRSLISIYKFLEINLFVELSTRDCLKSNFFNPFTQSVHSTLVVKIKKTQESTPALFQPLLDMRRRESALDAYRSDADGDAAKRTKGEKEGGKMRHSILAGICFLMVVIAMLPGGHQVYNPGDKRDIKSELKKWNAQSDEEVLQATLEDVRRFLRSKGSSTPTFGVSRGRYWYVIYMHA